MACGKRPVLVACMLLAVTPTTAWAKKHKPAPQPPVVQAAPAQEAAATPRPADTMPALVVPPNTTPEPQVILAPTPPPEPEPPPPPPPPARWAFGAKAGVLFPQPFAPTPTTGQGSIDGGYIIIPHLQAFGMLSYTQTSRSVQGTDLRLINRTYTSTVTAHQAGLTVGLMTRVLDTDAVVNPTASVGAQLLVAQLQQHGATGAVSFGDISQVSLQVGIYAAVGLEISAGPGKLVTELNLIYAPTAQPAATGSVLGGLGANVGYRLLFF